MKRTISLLAVTFALAGAADASAANLVTVRSDNVIDYESPGDRANDLRILEHGVEIVLDDVVPLTLAPDPRCDRPDRPWCAATARSRASMSRWRAARTRSSTSGPSR